MMLSTVAACSFAFSITSRSLTLPFAESSVDALSNSFATEYTAADEQNAQNYTSDFAPQSQPFPTKKFLFPLLERFLAVLHHAGVEVSIRAHGFLPPARGYACHS